MMSIQSEFRPRQTLADQVYQRLRADIINGRLAPNAILSETTVAKQLGVSRSPVKEALQRLGDEGLVIIRPQRPSRVAPLDLKRALDICELRALLEPYCARAAALNMQEEDLHRLKTGLASIDVNAPDGPEKLWELDDFMHLRVAEAAGNAEIVRILKQYYDYIHRIRISTAYRANRLPYSLAETRAIVEALERRDPEAAYETMRTHVTNIGRALERIRDQGLEV